MRRLRISKRGQVSIPADVRRRWGTHTVIAEDEGDRLVLRPVPDDPIAAVRGSLRGVGMSSDEAREHARRERAGDRAPQVRRAVILLDASALSR